MSTPLQVCKDLIISLVGKGEVILAINDLSFFGNLSHKEIITLLLDCGAGQEVEKNLYKFSDLDISTAEQLIERGVAHTVRRSISCFQKTDHEDIKQLLISKGYGNTLFETC